MKSTKKRGVADYKPAAGIVYFNNEQFPKESTLLPELHLYLPPKVTIEVVNDPQTEVEMDLAKEGRNDWSLSEEEWLGHKKLFWPLFWEYPDQAGSGPGQASLEDPTEDYNYDTEDPVLSGVGGGWGNRWNNGWDSSKENYGELSRRRWLCYVDVTFS